MKKVLLAIVLASSLAGCGTLGGLLSPTEKSILQGGMSVTAEIGQPISDDAMFNIEASYRAAVAALVAYRRQGICAPGASWTIQRPCAEEEVVVKLQKYLPAARSAMASLRRFRAQNDTVNAYRVFQEAKAAIAAVQQELFIAGVK